MIKEREREGEKETTHTRRNNVTAKVFSHTRRAILNGGEEEKKREMLILKLMSVCLRIYFF